MNENETKKVKLDFHNTVSPTELDSIVRVQMKSIMKDPKVSSELPPIMIHSSPGIGKSTIVKTVAQELGIGFIDARLTQMEPCDIKGLPVPDKENRKMDWYVNGIWPRGKDSFGILFLDELNSTDASVQCAAYELILDRRLGEMYKVPDGWLIVGAGNLTTDRAISHSMPSALANRFMHFELEANAEDWIMWAQTHDIHPSVVGFIMYRPEYLFRMENEIVDRGWPSPRAWERVSHMLSLYSDADEKVLRKIVYGLVGNRAGVEFMEFHKMNAKFDDVLEYMLNPKLKIVVPAKQDEKYALVSALIYLVWRGKDDKDQAARVDGFYRICMELSADFAAMAMQAAMCGNKQFPKSEATEYLFRHPTYKAWAAKYGKSIKRHVVIA